MLYKYRRNVLYVSTVFYIVYYQVDFVVQALYCLAFPNITKIMHSEGPSAPLKSLLEAEGHFHYD